MQAYSAQFTTVMHERHNVSMVVFGGKPGEPVEYKGMLWLTLFGNVKR